MKRTPPIIALLIAMMTAAPASGQGGQFIGVGDDAVMGSASARVTMGEVAEFRVNDLKRWAADIKLDTAAFNECLDSAKYKQEVAADFATATGVGLQGTPVFFINGRALFGTQPYATFQKIIEEELKK